MDGIVDTRPAMTRAEFEAAAQFAYERHWLTGEDAFLHVPAVMQVEGWNLYDHPGNLQLTEPQRVLMMWSDLVGQTQNGGFIQFVDNFAKSLELAYRLIEELEWPELFDHFDRAFREQAGDPADPQPDRWFGVDPLAFDREAIVAHLAARHSRWRPWARVSERARFDAMPDEVLRTLHDQAVERGELPPLPEADAEVEPRPEEAAEAFDDWFYRDETRAASKIHVGDYIRRHCSELCRLTD
jgi:hypothetical protein